MMRGNNMVIHDGRLGEDPKLSKTEKGIYVLTVDIAVYQGKDANEQTITEWFRWRIYGNLAEKISRAHKGDLLHLTGRQRGGSYVDQHGNRKWFNYNEADSGYVVPKENPMRGIIPQTDNTAEPHEMSPDITSDELPF